MGLSHEIISQFAKLVNDSDKNQNTESTIFGTVVDANGNKPGEGIVIDENGGKYFKPDGSDQLIPITENDEDIIQGSTTTNADFGDRASVLIKNHTATVTGNISSPSANNKDIETAIKKYGILVAEQIQANKAYFQKIIADEATISKLEAGEISVLELIAKEAEIADLIAGKITVTDLIATKIDADVVIADSGIIEHLKSGSIDVLSLIADKAEINRLIAEDADLNSVEAKNAYLKYANIDFSNIGEAAITKLFTDSGIIKDLIVSEGKITGELVGVTIKGDLIEAGTLKADRLVVKGSDGNYYALSTDFTAMPGITPVEEDSIHGSVLVKKSIVAEKIAVDDLNAFGATIGGFHIGEKSIYSDVKNSVNNTTRGIYMDTDGQFAIGDDKNYIKYGKDETGNYKLDISLVNDIEIGGRNILLNSSFKDNVDHWTLPEENSSVSDTVASDYGWIVTDDDVSSTKHNIWVTVRDQSNIIPYPYTDTTKTLAGITYTDNGDGSITINGTATGYAVFSLFKNSWNLLQDGVTYYSNTPYLVIRYKDGSGPDKYAGFSSSGTSFTWSDSYTLGDIYLQINPNVTVDNRTVYPFLNPTNATGIGDFSNVTVSRYGRNLLSREGSELYEDGDSVTNAGITFTRNSDGSITVNGTATGTMYNTIGTISLPRGTYYLNTFCPDGGLNGTNFYVYAHYDHSTNGTQFFHDTNGRGWPIVIKENTDALTVRFMISKGAVIDNVTIYPQIEAGGFATTYEPFKSVQSTKMDNDGIGGLTNSLTSVSPVMTVLADTPVFMHVQYQKDANLPTFVTKYGRECMHILLNDAGVYNGVSIEQDMLGKLELKTEYTLSGWFLNENISWDKNPIACFMYNFKIGNQIFSDTTPSFDLNNDMGTWKYFTWTFTTYDLDPDAITSCNVQFYAMDISGDIYISDLKLEKGNRATDWTPALEDMASMGDLNSTRDSLNKVIFEQSSSLVTNVNSISASVSTLETKLSKDVEGLNNRIETVEKDVLLKVTDESVDIKIQKAIYDGSKKVDTGTGITFDENGMNVSKEDTEGNKVGDTNTQITENGMYVNSNVTNTPVLTANKDGVQAKNLHAGKYLIIDDKSRFEAYGTDRVGCFWIGE